jgi:hypothetical protein
MTRVLIFIFLLVGCEPYTTSYIQNPIWSDDDVNVVFINEHATNYPFMAYSYQIDRSEIHVTGSQSVKDSVFVFEEGAGLSVEPLYFSGYHQVMIYKTQESTGFKYLNTFNLETQSKQTIQLKNSSPKTASISPNGDWIALLEKKYAFDTELGGNYMSFFRTNDLNESIRIRSGSVETDDSSPLIHWQGNDSVWITNKSGLTMFDLVSLSSFDVSEGCIEPLSHSGQVNSQGLRVDVEADKRSELKITNVKPYSFCGSNET